MQFEGLDTRRLENADDLNVLVVGDGAREHAFVWKLRQSERIGSLYITPEKAGTQHLAENYVLGTEEGVEAVVDIAQDGQIDLVVVTQDKWQNAGLVDALNAVGIPATAANSITNRLESDKAFSKQLMRLCGVPTSDFEVFSDPQLAHEFIEQLTSYPLYVKATGPADGKGAQECENASQAHFYVDELMVRRKLGEAGLQTLIEAYAPGEEVSLHAMSDGQHYLNFISAQDHKQVLDGDKGPMTGGMGVIAPVPWFNKRRTDNAHKRVGVPVLDAYNQAGQPFIGELYPGIKVTKSGLNVIEYNARWGSPEAQAYLRLLKSDLLELLVASVVGKLHKQKLEWDDGYAVSIVAASGGYPVPGYETGFQIAGLDKWGQVKDEDVVIFHGGTKALYNYFYTAGGRVLDVTATGSTLQSALDKAYSAMGWIHFEGMHFRKDIGQRPSPFN